jgi:hypothetical protein
MRFGLSQRLFEEAGAGADGGGAGAAAGTAEATTEAKSNAAAAELEALRNENATLKSRGEEAEGAARYWHEQAKGTGAGDKGKPAEADREDDTDLLAVASKGPKAMKEWLAKEGFVSGEEVDRRVETRAQQIGRETQLGIDYPDLKDKTSEFFKAVAVQYGDLRKTMDAHDAMERACEKVELANLRAGKTTPITTGKGKPNDDAGDDDRQGRARAQQGDPGRRQSRSEPGTDELDAIQLRICKAMGVSPEAYAKRAKEGVQTAR